MRVCKYVKPISNYGYKKNIYMYYYGIINKIFINYTLKTFKNFKF